MRWLLLVLLTAVAGAEVMDKEPTLRAIWEGAFFAVPSAWLAGRWAPALGWMALPPLLSAIGATAECYDRFVGPAIVQEAGVGYVIQAHAALGLAVAGYGVGLIQRRQANRP